MILNNPLAVVQIGEMGYEAGLYGLGLCKKVTDGLDYWDFQLAVGGVEVHPGDGAMEAATRMAKAARACAEAGNGHESFLELIQTWWIIKAPLFLWRHLDRYRHKSQLSTSTMHTLKARAVAADDFAFPIPEGMLNHINERMAAGADDEELANLLPSGYMQTRVVSVNYRELAHIFRQRRGHKLGLWRKLLVEVAGRLGHPHLVGVTPGGDPIPKGHHAAEQAAFDKRRDKYRAGGDVRSELARVGSGLVTDSLVLLEDVWPGADGVRFLESRARVGHTARVIVWLLRDDGALESSLEEFTLPADARDYARRHAEMSLRRVGLTPPRPLALTPAGPSLEPTAQEVLNVRREFIRDVHDVVKEAERHGSKFFSPENMRAGCSRLGEEVWHGADGVYFCTSDKGPDGGRIHCVRVYSRDRGVKLVSHGCTRRSAAKRVAAIMAAESLARAGLC
jgi:hypothetical protein